MNASPVLNGIPDFNTMSDMELLQILASDDSIVENRDEEKELNSDEEHQLRKRKKEYSCPWCVKKYFALPNLCRHEREDHKEEYENEKKRKRLSKQGKCLYCDNKYKAGSSLDNHIRIHHDDKNESWKLLKKEIKFCEGMEFIELLDEAKLWFCITSNNQESINSCCVVLKNSFNIVNGKIQYIPVDENYFKTKLKDDFDSCLHAIIRTFIFKSISKIKEEDFLNLSKFNKQQLLDWKALKEECFFGSLETWKTCLEAQNLQTII
jgi:hypothetical protein